MVPKPGKPNRKGGDTSTLSLELSLRFSTAQQMLETPPALLVHVSPPGRGECGEASSEAIVADAVAALEGISVAAMAGGSGACL